ncbi:hypothetical protein L208DRAFT_1381462 [Tricholoma matsutake]|nr:hypothetical protein L208DRAFT_1381462 [Tricholoma matsutake 945]
MFSGEDKVTKYAPILFENGVKDMQKMFRCKHLALMLCVILFGRSSLNEGKKKPGSPSTYRKLWGISNVTPGVIAGVLVIFQQTGVTSQIHYQKIFNQLKEIIMHNSGTPQYRSLFQWFNHLVFNWTTNVDLVDDDYDSGIKDAIIGVTGLQIDDEEQCVHAMQPNPIIPTDRLELNRLTLPSDPTNSPGDIITQLPATATRPQACACATSSFHTPEIAEQLMADQMAINVPVTAAEGQSDNRPTANSSQPSRKVMKKKKNENKGTENSELGTPLRHSNRRVEPVKR